MDMSLHRSPRSAALSRAIERARPGFIPGAMDLVLGLPWRRITAGICLAVGLSAAVLAEIWLHPRSPAPHLLARIDGPLPSVKVEASGMAVDVGRFASGARAVIVFYSPSCRICREVLPALKALSSSPLLIRLIMIRESGALSDSEISEFRDADFFYDRWGALRRLFAIPTLPAVLLVDERGIIRDGFVGFHERDWILEKLTEFAGARRGPASDGVERDEGWTSSQ